MAFTVTMNADVSPSARPIYHSPEVGGIARPRQGSMRKSSYTTPLPPGVESERTAIPAERDRETDTFNINPKFLAGWLPTQDLWAQLPSNLQDAIRHVQKTGASVLSGYERLEQYSDTIDLGPNTPEDEMLVQLDDTSALEDSITSLPSVSSLNSHHFIPRLRAESSNGSSVVISSPSSGTHSPKWDNDSVFAGPISPISLAADSISSSNRNRERSFSTPLEPHNAKYITELSYVRSEAAPRLRHAVRAVDTEWTQVLNNKAIPSRDLKEKFENWWANKKCYTMTLEEKAKRLGDAAGIRANGLGWTAP